MSQGLLASTGDGIEAVRRAIEVAAYELRCATADLRAAHDGAERSEGEAMVRAARDWLRVVTARGRRLHAI